MPFRKSLLGELLDYSDPLTRGLVGLWLFNEGSGNLANDLSGNGLNLTLSGPTWGIGNSGPVLKFDGTDDTATRTGASQLPGKATAITLISRVKRLGAQPDSGFGILYLEEKTAGVQPPIAAFLQDTGFRFRLNTITDDSSGNSWEISNNFVVGESHTIAWTWQSGETLKAYFDGVQQTLSFDAGTLTGTLKISDDTISIGLSALDLFADVDWLYIYNRALAASEIAEVEREPFRFVSGARRRRFYAFPEIAAGVVNAAGQADIVISSLAGFRRLNRPGAAQADIITSSLAGFRRLNRPGAGKAAIVTSSLSGMTKTWNAAAQASIVTSSLAGMRRLNRPGAAQAAINIQTFAGATGGSAAITLEEIFRYRRYRDAGVFRRRNLKGVY